MARRGNGMWPLWLRLWLAALLALGGLAVLPPTPARAAGQTFTVTTLEDRNGTCAPGDCSLREAIRAAEVTIDADTIAIAASGTIALGSTLPVVTTPLTISGAGVSALSIQGDNTFPLLIVNAPGHAVALSGLTLTGGRAVGGYGGNLRSVGGNLALTDVALTDATAAAGLGGAGAYLGRGTSILTRVVISGNTAPGSANFGTGAGLYVDEYYGDSTVTIADSTIVANADTAFNGGGGIVVWRASGLTSRTLDVRLVNSVVGTAASPNSANVGGGIFSFGGNVTLTNSTIGGNLASQVGGGIYASGGSLTLADSTVGGNRAAGGYGGGIFLSSATATLTNVTLSDNTAARGGGFYNEYATVTFTNATISGNRATNDEGGGINNYRGTVRLAHAAVVGNDGGVRAEGTASAIYLRASIVAGNGTMNCAVIGTTNTSLITQGANVVGTGCPVTVGTGDATVTGALSTVVDPALADNGGPTRTHALAPGSPALDRVPTADCTVTTDQRGVARPQGAQCDSGAVESTAAAPSPSPGPSPSLSPNPSPSPGAQVTLIVATAGFGTVGRVPAGTGGGPYSYPPGTPVTLTPQPGAGQSFVGWLVDGVYRGWAPALSLTMDTSHSVQATFAPTAGFPDVGGGRADYAAIVALASRGTIRGYANGTYGPDDGVQRAQMAALIARATSAGPGTPPTALAPPACLVAGTWDCESWGTGFSDQSGLDPNLWRNVGTLQHYRVAFGYDGAACAARGVASPCYGPTEAVSYAQTITFITRMMQTKGYWVAQPGAPLPYGGVPGPHAADVATFAYYAGGVPAPPGDWSAGATRGWFARALWAALNTYWGTEGALPDGHPAGGDVP